MATKKQKEELMQTLKFTPRNYKVEITGRGGEIYFGSVDRKIYEFFKEKKIDIEQYASGWDEDMWNDIPEDMRPFPPGSPYDISGVHESGATFSDESMITVSDENGNEVWSCDLGIALQDQGVEIENTDDVEIYGDDGTVYFYGAQGEKGLFFGNEFKITAPFDPKKLKITYGCYDGWDIVSSVIYDGEYIDSYDYDTTGKWAENKWIIMGDEDPYDGEEREEGSSDFEDEDDDE